MIERPSWRLASRPARCNSLRWNDKEEAGISISSAMRPAGRAFGAGLHEQAKDGQANGVGKRGKRFEGVISFHNSNIFELWNGCKVRMKRGAELVHIVHIYALAPHRYSLQCITLPALSLRVRICELLDCRERAAPATP